MVNPLPEDMISCSFGELLVQLRLLQFGMQSLVPHKDSGNDLVTFFHKKVFKTVQVKTTSEIPVKLNRSDPKILI